MGTSRASHLSLVVNRQGPQPLRAGAIPRATLPCPALSYIATLKEGKGRDGIKTRLRLAAKLIDGSTFESFDWRSLSAEAVNKAILACRDANYAPATQRLLKAALRGVLRHARRAGCISSTELHDIIDEMPKVRGSRPPAGRALTRDEVAAFFRVILSDTTPVGRRDAAMLAVLFSTGCRKEEVVLLDRSDYDTSTGEVRIMGKGDKVRVNYVTDPALKLVVSSWLDLRGWDPGPLFLPSDKVGGFILDRRLNSERIWRVVKSGAQKAGIKRCTPHDFRRTVLTWLKDSGVDLDTIRRFAGHENIQTTVGYFRSGAEQIRSAAESIRLPPVS